MAKNKLVIIENGNDFDVIGAESIDAEFVIDSCSSIIIRELENLDTDVFKRKDMRKYKDMVRIIGEFRKVFLK